MESLLYVLGVFMLLVSDINSLDSRNDSAILSRRKRYVAFPEGSTLIFALCMTQQTIMSTGTFQIFTEGVNWGIAYELPNRTTFIDHIRDKRKKGLKSRQRRDLYSRIEVVLDSMGVDGRSCIYRALCETARTASHESTLSEKMLRLLFRFSVLNVPEMEAEEHSLYRWAYQKGKANKQQDCAKIFPACPVSLRDLVLGHYNEYAEEHHYGAPTSSTNQ